MICWGFWKHALASEKTSEELTILVLLDLVGFALDSRKHPPPPPFPINLREGSQSLDGTGSRTEDYSFPKSSNTLSKCWGHSSSTCCSSCFVIISFSQLFQLVDLGFLLSSPGRPDWLWGSGKMRRLDKKGVRSWFKWVQVSDPVTHIPRCGK